MNRTPTTWVPALTKTCLALSFGISSPTLVAGQCVRGHAVNTEDVVAALAADSTMIDGRRLRPLTFLRGKDTLTVWLGQSSFRQGNSTVSDSPIILFSTGQCVFTAHWKGIRSPGLTESETWNAAIRSLHGIAMDSTIAVALGAVFGTAVDNTILRIESPLLTYPAPQGSLVPEITARRVGARWHVSIHIREHLGRIECAFDQRGRLLHYSTHQLPE